MNKGKRRIIAIEDELKGNARRSRTREQCKKVKS
jgi:hypothetical protein